MRWMREDRGPKPDPKSYWHRRFAWLPVIFVYGTVPDRAWLEVVLAKRTYYVNSAIGNYWRWEYQPAEYAKKYPQQYGPGRN